MALVLQISKGAVDANLAYFYLTDSTGVYDVTDNPGGYGTPNPARNTLALYLYGYKYRANPTDDEAITINNTIPETVTQWEIPMTEDGYRYFRLLAVPLWDSSAQVTGNIRYYQSKYYIATGNSTNLDPINNTGVWAEITDLTTAAVYANTSIYVLSYDIVTNYFGKQCMQTQMFNEANTNCNCDDNNRTEVRPYQKVFSMLYTAGILCAQAKYAQADDELLALSEYCSTLDCSTC